MAWPRPTEASKAFFDALVPDDPRVTVRPMFGNHAAFLNGLMFLGLLGEQVAVRLAEPDRAELLETEGAGLFEPMEGRPMREYVVLPEAWREELGEASVWVARSVDWVETLSPKKAKK